MAITFPASPVNGQTHTENGQIFVFDSTRGYWLLKKQDQIVASTSRSTFVATAGQTVHTVNYDPSASVIVSVNGVMLNPQDITSTNGTSIIFDTALALSDEVDIVFHQPTASNLIRQDISDPMATESYVQTYVTNNSSVGVTTVADMAALIALTGMANGDQALVTANNNLFIYSGSGWYKIATVQNDSPSAITGVSGTYELAIDGTATVITAVSTDPEGFPLTWSYSASGIGSIATVSQSDNVFTITPSTTEADAGTFTLTINATDGVNGAVSTTTNLTLEFIVIVTNSRYTTLLATATGTSDNNNITDTSTNNHSITVNGDACVGTFSPYRHSGYSTYFPDTDGNAYVSANSSDYALGSGALTVSAWIYIDNNTQQQTIIDNQTGSGAGWYLKIWPGQLIRVHNQSSYIFDISNSDAPTAVNEWIHLCWTRDGSGNNKLFLNGTQVGTTVTDTTNFTAQGCKLGETYQGVNDLKGYIKDVHIVAGYANEPTTSSIATAVTSGTGTVFLGCSGPDFLERSSSPKTITINGNNIFIRPFSPYDNLEYSVTDHGGAINFDGNGDYLTIPDHSSLNFASNDWTIECWIYPRTNVGDCGIWHQSASSGTDWFSLYLDGSFNPKFVLKNNNAEEWAGTAAANTAPQNTWTHIALVRRFGTDIKLYANGKVVHTETQHLNVALENKTYNHVIGYERFVGNGTYFDGLISDFKMDIGTAHYTAEFTPPTAPLSSTASDLHIKGTDASIIDKSQSSNLKLFGNTTGSTTQVKFANTKSMYFDGTGDYVFVPASSLLDISSSDITIEGYFYTTSTSVQQGVWEFYSDDNNYARLFFDGGNGNVLRLTLYSSGTPRLNATGTTTLSINTWYHIAVTRDHSSGAWKTFIGGVQDTGASGAESSAVDTSLWNFEIGRDLVATDRYWNGYIQDFRITKGLARYTANFTPPTAPLKG